MTCEQLCAKRLSNCLLKVLVFSNSFPILRVLLANNCEGQTQSRITSGITKIRAL